MSDPPALSAKLQSDALSVYPAEILIRFTKTSRGYRMDKYQPVEDMWETVMMMDPELDVLPFDFLYMRNPIYSPDIGSDPLLFAREPMCKCVNCFQKAAAAETAYVSWLVGGADNLVHFLDRLDALWGKAKKS